MPMKANHKCITCGREYYFCNACSLNDDAWRKVACTKECYDTYLAFIVCRDGGDAEEFAQKVDAIGIDPEIMNEGMLTAYHSVREEAEPEESGEETVMQQVTEEENNGNNSVSTQSITGSGNAGYYHKHKKKYRK